MRVRLFVFMSMRVVVAQPWVVAPRDAKSSSWRWEEVDAAASGKKRATGSRVRRDTAAALRQQNCNESGRGEDDDGQRRWGAMGEWRWRDVVDRGTKKEKEAARGRGGWVLQRTNGFQCRTRNFATPSSAGFLPQSRVHQRQLSLMSKL